MFLSSLAQGEQPLICCLVISLCIIVLIFSMCDVNLRAEHGSLFLSAEVFAFPIFICIDCEVFHQKK